MKKLIGLSLSFCVKEICQGKIPLEAVEAIVPNFVIDVTNTKEEVFERYKQVYWKDFPDQARLVLDQVKLLPMHPGGVRGPTGHWIAAEVYSPELKLSYDDGRVSDILSDELTRTDEMRMCAEEAIEFLLGESAQPVCQSADADD